VMVSSSRVLVFFVGTLDGINLQRIKSALAGLF
jgi:hypothetical protein